MEIALLPIAKQFNKKAISVKFLTRCRNEIYKVISSDNEFVLRLTSVQHRSAEQINSELDFQKYLFDNGADVAKPLQTEWEKVVYP